MGGERTFGHLSEEGAGYRWLDCALAVKTALAAKDLYRASGSVVRSVFNIMADVFNGGANPGGVFSSPLVGSTVIPVSCVPAVVACHPSNKPHETERSGHTYSPALACPVAKQDCVNCHMPKLEIPGSHFKFSDHWIRIAKAESDYPE